ncbi:MAG: LPS export ABC transporter permease LptF [Burkholderiales bacterium]|nr:LPS export ABC transporter permease LptF [Burkholderiales bacterium]
MLFSIVVTIGLVQILNQTAGGKYEPSAILEVVAYSSLVNLPPLIALALFLAVFMSLNRYWRDSEMYVWFSAGGCSLLSWVRPVLVFTVPVVVLVAACSMTISPWSRGEMASYRDRFANRDEVSKLSSGQFIEAKNGEQVFFLEAVDQERGTVRGVFMAETKKDGPQSIVVADRGHLEVRPNGDRYVILNDGKRYETLPSGKEAQVTDFEIYEARLDQSPQTKTTNYRIDSMPFVNVYELQKKDNQAKGEFFWRISWPIVAFMLALLAIPLSYNNPRQLKYYGQTAAVLVFILYLNCMSIFKTWVASATFTIPEAIAIMNTPFLVLMIFLYYRLLTMNTSHFDFANAVYVMLKPFRIFRRKKKTEEEDQ